MPENTKSKGPIPLPNHKGSKDAKYSSSQQKTTREAFEAHTHKRLLDILAYREKYGELR